MGNFDALRRSYKWQHARFRLLLFVLMLALIGGPGRYTMGLVNDVSAPLPSGSPLWYTIITSILIVAAFPLYVREARRLDRLKAKLEGEDPQ